MRVFRTDGGAGVTYKVGFAQFPYANISFFDRSRETILFHLSLRAEKGVAACNARDGKKWRREILREIDFDAAGDQVAIRLEDSGQIAIRLGEAPLFAFEPGEFPALERIAFVNYGGGVEEGSFRMEGAANAAREGEGNLGLMPLLVLEGWGADPEATAQTHSLDVDGLAEPLPVQSFERPDLARRLNIATDMVGAYGVLPGRVWRVPGADQGLIVQLRTNGIPCGAPLRITHQDVTARIEAMAETDPKAGAEAVSSFAALQALEHTHYAGLYPRLSAKAQGFVSAVADLYGQRALLEGAEGAEPLPERSPPPPDIVLMDRMRGAFLDRVAAEPKADPAEILAEALAESLPPPPVRRRLFLALTEHFCGAERFDALYDLAARYGDADFQRAGNPWHDTLTLPFLFRRGDAWAINKILADAAAKEKPGGSTITLAWLVRRLAAGDPPRPGPEAAEEMLASWFTFVEKMAESYWDRAACHDTTRAMAALVLAEDQLAAPFRARALQVALRVFGLSKGFWAGIDAAGGTLQGALAMARAAYGEIEAAALSGKGDLAPAFRVFERAGTMDLARHRIELLGPAGVADPKGAAGLRRLHEAVTDVPAAALRALAFPGAGEDAALALPAAEAVRQAHHEDGLKSAPFHGLQARIGAQLGADLAGLAQGRPLAEDALETTYLPAFTTLAGPKSTYLGLGLGLTLLEGLLAAGEIAPAGRLLSHLGTLVGELSQEALTGLRRAASVQGALWRLKARSEPLAEAALALFPRIAATLVAQPRIPADLASRWAGTSPLYSILVTVISCKANLTTRIPAMRDGWLKDLEALGIPYVIVTGDGDGTLAGDVLALNAPDDYEGLPAKTLALADWVATNTPFAYLLKIDDDCLLNAEGFFQSLSYLKFDYYGRRIIRRRGNMDRNWHWSKSVSERGRLELDKSPEPSVYCDGGSAYTLSRRAMVMLGEAQTWHKNRQLVQSSFMEDKLVGDLLASGGIRPADEDYYVAVQRRTHGPAIPVGLWANSFHPSKAAPIKMVHLDSAAPQGPVRAAMGRADLRPKKLWPSFQAPKLGLDTNTLELVSDEAKLARLNKAPLAVVATMRNEMFMIPHFLAHYRRLGVEAFLIADNCSDDGTLEYLADQPDVATFSVDTQYAKSSYGVAWQQAILAGLRMGRWSLVADADELLVYPGWEKMKLGKYLARPAFKEADAVRIFMLDMYPKGSMAAADFASGDPFAEAGQVERQPFLTNWPGRGPFSNGSTWTSALRHRLIPGSFPALFVAQKIALLKYRPWMRLSAGLHYVAEARLAADEMLFAHFKYNAEFRNKALAETRRRQHFNNAEEYQKYLALLSEGRDQIYDPSLSVPWREAEFVKRIMG